METNRARTARAQHPRFFSRILLLVLLLARLKSSAQDVTCAFLEPAKPLVAGARSSLWLFCMNGTAADVQRTFDPRLAGDLIAGTSRSEITLSLNTNSGALEVTIPPGGFIRREYILEVPLTTPNQVLLAISNYNQLTLTVTNPGPLSPLVSPEPVETVPPIAANASEQRSFSPLVTHFSKYLTPYEPIYFLLGTTPAGLFQFSLKYQLVDLATTNGWVNWLNDFYFAYTQTSYWDILSSNPSFYDTSYKPSAFFYFHLLHTKDVNRMQLNLQSGYEHESNGTGGTGERSLNTIYAQPNLSLGLFDSLNLSLSPRLWRYIGVSDNNRDLDQYRGYGELNGTLSWLNNYRLTTRYRSGVHGDHTSLKFDLSFALPKWTGFTPRLHAQYFTGYGETLRQYNEGSHSFRVGISLYD